MARLASSAEHRSRCLFRRLVRPGRSFGISFADRVDYLDLRVWDALVAQSGFFLSRDFLRVMETDGPAGIEPRYAIVFRGREPIAAVAAQLTEIRASQVTRACETATGRIRSRVLVCGNLLTFGRHGVAFARGVAPDEGWSAAIEAIERIREVERLTRKTDLVLVKDLPAADPDAPEALERARFARHETEPEMVLAIPGSWRRFDDYLDRLNAKYRKAARGIRARVDEAGYRLERLEDLAPDAERLHALYLQVAGQAAVRPVELPVSFLPALARAAADRFRAWALRRDGRIDGFATLVLDGDTAVGFVLGFDREANEEAPIYLCLLQALLEGAIESGVSRLSLGRTALEPKARLGARPEPLAIYVRHANPVLHWILAGLLGRATHDAPPERSPFKEPIVPADPVEGTGRKRTAVQDG